MHRELAELLRSELKDPRVGMVGIHEVQVSRDLAVAKVYVGLLMGGVEEARASVAALNQAASFLRKELGRRMRLRSVPEIRFVYDDSSERGARISQLLSGNVPPADAASGSEE